MLIKSFVMATAFTLISGAALAASPLEGTWLTESGKTHVRIAPCGANMCGDIVWVNGDIKDEFNPDAAKRSRSIKGVRVLIDMAPAGGESTYKGHAYNTNDGKTYSGTIRSTGADKLELTGCVAAIFCKSQTWTRVK